MRHRMATAAIAGLVAAGMGLGSSSAGSARAGEPSGPRIGQTREDHDVEAQAQAFLKDYHANLARLELRANLASWKAANSGLKEDFAAAAEAALALRKFHSDADAHRRLKGLLASQDALGPLEARALQVAELDYRANQLPADLLERMVAASSDIERTLSTFRGELDGKKLSNNELLEMLRKEDGPARRRQIWEALKQAGGAVGPKLVGLARLRNQAARQLGFDNYWQMQVRLQEHEPGRLLAVFDELDRLTREPFAKAKAELDGELAARFKTAPEELMPWHYDNPFFQAAPPSDKVDANEFYEKKTREEIVEIARAFYRGVGLPADEVLKRSDLYERPGKDQHAFCTSIDRAGDVRTLCNVKPTAEWMGVVLHELGHAVYDLGVDRKLPYNLRGPAHAFTTEGVAMLFGAAAEEPGFLVRCAGADEARVQDVAGPLARQRRREQLIFARWTMVMLHFEKALYEDPEQDLNKLWWDHVERFQRLKRPPGRSEPDWAAKPHFTSAPVYYHNYMLGELFAAQLRRAAAQPAGGRGQPGQRRLEMGPALGAFLQQKVFAPGASAPWPEFVRRATGEPLTARYYAAEVAGD